MIYNLSISILFKNRYFNNAVFPHSLGPDIIHLKVSGNLRLTILILSFIHDCRLPLTSINKIDGEARSEVLTPTLLPPPHPHPNCEQALSLCLVGEGRALLHQPRTSSL